MVSSWVILLAGTFLLLCQLIRAAPTNSTSVGSQGVKTDAIPNSAKLRAIRQAIYQSNRRQNPDYDDDSAAALAAIPFADEDSKLTDNDQKQKTSSTTVAPKVKREAFDDVQRAEDVEPAQTPVGTNSEEAQSHVDADPNREVDVVFVPVIIREKQIIFIEEDPQAREQEAVPDNDESTPLYDDTTDSTPLDDDDYTDTTVGSTIKTPSTASNLVNPDDDFDPIVSIPSQKVNTLPKGGDSEEVHRQKRDTSNTTDASSKPDDNSGNSTDIVDFVVSIFQFGPLITAPDDSKSDATASDNAASTDHVRKARDTDSRGSSKGNDNNRNNQGPIRPRYPPPTPPPRQNRPTPRTSPRPVPRTSPRPAPRPAPRPEPIKNSRPAPMSPNRGKRSNGNCGPCGRGGPVYDPVRPNGRGGGGGGGRGGGGSSSAVASADATSNSAGRGSSSASASATANASSGRNVG